MPTEQSLSQQRRLTGALQLFKELGCESNKISPYLGMQEFHTLPFATQSELGTLNTIAALLTSGRQGDVTAATFDDHDGLSLVLAKNRLPTAQDVETTRSLFSIIMNPSTHTAMDLSHFLLTHCRENMQKRILNLHQCLSDFCTKLPASHSKRTDYNYALSRYRGPMSFAEEFPKTVTYDFGTPKPSFKDAIRGLFESCIRQSRFDLDPADPKDAMRKYRRLSRSATVLFHSRFLRAACQRIRRGERAKKLKRLLAEVCQYYVGVRILIRKAKHLFHDDIPFHWVDDTFFDSGEGEIRVDNDYLQPLHGMLQMDDSFLSAIRTKLAQTFPDLESNWENRRRTKTTIHAEIRIILHFLHQRPCPSHLGSIGCSSRTCLCCALWIPYYNMKFRTSWLTGGSDGRLQTEWALPGRIPDEDKMDRVGGSTANEVLSRLRHILWTFPFDLAPLSDESDLGGSGLGNNDHEGDLQVFLQAMGDDIGKNQSAKQHICLWTSFIKFISNFV